MNSKKIITLTTAIFFSSLVNLKAQTACYSTQKEIKKMDLTMAADSSYFEVNFTAKVKRHESDLFATETLVKKEKYIRDAISKNIYFMATCRSAAYILNPNETNIIYCEFEKCLGNPDIGITLVHLIAFDKNNIKDFNSSKYQTLIGEILASRNKKEKQNTEEANKQEFKNRKHFKDIEVKMTNPALEAKIMKYRNEDKLTNSANKGKTFLKVKLVSEDWIIVRNEATGVIVGRTIDAAISYKDADGNCGIELDCYRQDYNGSGYQEKVYYVRRPFLDSDHKDITRGLVSCD